MWNQGVEKPYFNRVIVRVGFGPLLFKSPPARHSFSAYRLAASGVAPLSSFSQMASSDPLVSRLKHLIVTTLKLEDVDPAQMADDEPLIGSGLNLDSIDALELVVTLEKEFGIKISSSEESRQALTSIAHLAEYIRVRADPARIAS
jgi:acyl carrier protein